MRGAAFSAKMAVVLAPDSLVLEGRFRVIRPLGSGGMGEVYLGEQVSLGRKVAIKVLHHDLHMQAGMAERFKREARLLSAVEHPAVVRIIDFGESGDAACLVMELVEGVSLYEALHNGPLAPARALAVLHQLSEGLAAIHEKGIIHRDIKPENVFLTRGPRGEQARLLDFGIARLVEPEADSAVSQVGVVLGTPEYLSPEQAIGARVDTRSDLYCLGVLAYRILSGRLPFEGPSPRQFIAQHANAAPLPLDRAAPAFATNPSLVSLVMRLLEKEPANRFQSAQELAEALVAAAAGPLPAAIAPPAPQAPSTTPPISSGTAVFGASAPVPTGNPPPLGSGTAVFGEAAVGQEARGPTQVISPASSGTAVFGVSPPLSSPVPPPASSGTAVFGAPASSSASLPPPASSGTAVFGAPALPPAPVSTGTLTSKPQNLTLMLTSIQGFAELTSRQTREEHLRMLETYEQLLLPLVREYSGKLVQKRGDSLLAVFESPTGAVLCGMGIQDRLWRHNQTAAAESQLHIRVCLHAGEVMLTRDTVLGEPMEVVKATEQVALAGEVTFTESVNLARNRAEVVAEPCGTIPLPGRGEALQLYRSKRAAEGPPFGGRDMGSAATEKRPLLPLRPSLGALRQKAMELSSPRRFKALGVAWGVLLIIGVGLWMRNRSPANQARRLLEEGQPAEALKRLDAVPAEDRKAPQLRQVRALALHALNRHEEEHDVLLALDAEARQDVEARVMDGLAEDFGRGEGDKGLRKLLGALPQSRLHDHFEELAESPYSPKQWGALRYLEAMQDTEGLDLVELYAAALASEDCGVRVKAARRLGALGDTDAVSALTKLAQEPKEKQLIGAKNCGQDEAAAALQSLKKAE